MAPCVFRGIPSLATIPGNTWFSYRNCMNADGTRMSDIGPLGPLVWKIQASFPLGLGRNLEKSLEYLEST